MKKVLNFMAGKWVYPLMVLVLLVALGGYGYPQPLVFTPGGDGGYSSQAFVYPTGAIYFGPGGKTATWPSGSSLTMASGSTLSVAGTFAVSGVQTLGDGTAAAPALAFTSDTDTGLYRVGANNMGVGVSGTTVMDWNQTSTDANALPITNIGNAGTDFSATGGLTLADALTVSSGGATVTAGGLTVTAGGATVTAGGLTVTAGSTALNGGLTMDGTAFTVADTSGNVKTGGTLNTVGAASLASAVITGSATVGGGYGSTGCTLSTAGAIQCDDAATFGTGLTVTSGGATVTAGGATVTAGGLTVTAGSTALNGGLTMDGTAFTVADTSGNVRTAGTLQTVGAATLASAVITGATALNGGLTMDTNAFTVADTSGNVRTAGTLRTVGAATLASAVITGSLAADSATVGGGYGSTGCTLTTAGLISCDGAGKFGTLESVGAATLASAVITGALSADSVSTTGAATFGGVTRSDGNFTASAFAIFASQNITPVNATPFTPTHSVVILVPASAVTPTVAACVTNGTWLVLYNSAAHNVVLEDSGNFQLSGPLTLGQYDTLQLMCIATRWTQLAAPVNN